jgi:hypothetical protein
VNIVLGGSPTPRITPIVDTRLPNAGGGGSSGNAIAGGLFGALLVGGGMALAAAGMRARRA